MVIIGLNVQKINHVELEIKSLVCLYEVIYGHYLPQSHEKFTNSVVHVYVGQFWINSNIAQNHSFSL